MVLLRNFNMQKWLELAHEKRGHIYPTTLYWLGAQYAAKQVGVKDNVIGCWYVNHEFSYMATPGGLAVSGKKILEKLSADKKFLQRIVAVNRKEIPVMLKAAKRLSGKELAKFSGQELYKRWEDWLNKFLSMMTWSVMGTVMEMETPLLTQELEKVLIKRLGKGHPKIGEYFQILTTATERTIAGEEEIDLLKLRLVDSNKKLSTKAIANHLGKYSWIAFGYDGPSWNEGTIRYRLDELSKNKIELQKIIKEKLAADKVLLRQQKRAIAAVKLSQHEQYMFEVLRTLGFWKFERKFRNQQAHEMMEDFIKEIARRNKLTVAQTKMIAPYEIKEVLLRKRVSPDLLNERIRESVTIFRGTEYEILSGKSVAKIRREIKRSLAIDSKITELRGTTAYPGQATGAVKRVDEPHEMDKVKVGDILISLSTSPQILPAMKRAGAIVTDSGGITCHAAIVAREIKVPTLIGTKIATKVFHDGDTVEVDATKGVVKKV